MAIRLADFIAPFKGSIKHEEISRLSKAAAEDVAELYAKQLEINARLANELRAVNAEYASLSSLVNGLNTNLNLMISDYEAAADEGVLHHLTAHGAYINDAPNNIRAHQSYPLASISTQYGQVTLGESSGSINRLPYFTDQDGVPHISSSVSVEVTTWDPLHPDDPGTPITPTGEYDDPKLALVADPKQYWLGSSPTPAYSVVISVPEIRGAGANMLSFVPLPISGTTCLEASYFSTAGIYVPIKIDSVVGAQRLYFYAPDFGNKIRLRLSSNAVDPDDPSKYIIGLYNLSLKQEAFTSEAGFAVRLPSDGPHLAKTITSFLVDYDVIGLDRGINPTSFADIKLYGGTVMRPTVALDVPIGLTKDMPPVEVAQGSSAIEYLWLVAVLRPYNGVTPVYKGCTVTYLT